MSYKELVNKTELQRLQDELCAVAGVLAYCVNAEGEQITELSGTEEEKMRVEKYLSSDEIKNVLFRVEDGALEDLAIDSIKELDAVAAAVAVRVSEGTVFYWVIIGLGGAEASPHFCRVLDLVRDTSYTLIENKISCFSAEAESRRCQSAQQAMSRDLHTIEATTAIVQLLDSEQSVEEILAGWLQIMAEYLQVDTAQVFGLCDDISKMDVVCEWRERGQVSFFDKTSRIPACDFLYTTKPLVLSAKSDKGDYHRIFEQLRIKAVMVFPINNQANGSRQILCLNHRKQAHNWTMEEVKFVSDATKVMQSILTKRYQENKLAGSHAVMEAILDNVQCAVYVEDKATRNMLFANKKWQNTFAKDLQPDAAKELLNQGGSNEKNSGYFEIFCEEKARWYDISYKEICWVDGRTATIYSLFEITDKKVYQKKIEQQAYTDFLTGLYNRMCCERDLARQIDEAKHHGEKGALLYLDLDDFKHINDGLGHQYGDVLLKAISLALKNVNGIRKTCYRMGGDEFVVVVPPEYYGEFDRILQDIRQIFSKPWYLKDADYYCTASMGIVTFPDAGDSVADLIKKADIAMYEAKKSGKNRTARYEEGIDTVSGRRLNMEKNMRDAANGGYKEFEVYYQPIINVELGGKQCAGAEALIRWNSEKLGFISPSEFIPLAEYLGLINPIGNYILREACTHCKEWNDKGYPDYKVNVNLSVVQLLQNDIVEIVETALRETQVNPANLTLEVTESLAINDMERMKVILHRIKALGVKIALDDFGTGYSSLNHIREIPFDVIKVDQSFVRDLADDSYSRSFIKMIAELGQSIGVSICVEGIETKEQLEALEGMKVKYIQGYYFDRPMKRENFQLKYVS